MMNLTTYETTNSISQLLLSHETTIQDTIQSSDQITVLRSDDFSTIDEFKSEYQRCDQPVLCLLQPDEVSELIHCLRDSDDIGVVGEPESLTQWRIDRITKAHAQRLDPLTKVHRRNQLVETLGPICQAASNERPVSLILLDLDHFKAINDESGPHVGDQVLSRLGELIRSLCRETLVARTRGGEFAVLVQADGAVAKKIALIIQTSLNSSDWSDVPNITASFGVAAITSPCVPSLILTQADEALFAAKANGRNKVVCHSEIAALSNRHHDELAVVAMENKARVLSERVTSFVTHRSKRIMQSLRKEANTDGLTELFNRRYFDKQFSDDFSVAVESGQSLCLALVDLDHFGEVNKAHGWPTGDKVLREVAQSILKSTRASDWVGRYGGEEICVVMPGTELAAAKMACERIRETIDSTAFQTTSGNPLKVTLSIGVVEANPAIDQHTDALLERVSQLTLTAKTNGRNQVCDR